MGKVPSCWTWSGIVRLCRRDCLRVLDRREAAWWCWLAGCSRPPRCCRRNRPEHPDYWPTNASTWPSPWPSLASPRCCHSPLLLALSAAASSPPPPRCFFLRQRAAARWWGRGRCRRGLRPPSQPIDQYLCQFSWLLALLRSRASSVSVAGDRL